MKYTLFLGPCHECRLHCYQTDEEPDDELRDRWYCVDSMRGTGVFRRFVRLDMEKR